jgi:hypothetical protein
VGIAQWQKHMRSGKGMSLAQHIGCNKFIAQTNCMQVVETRLDGGFSATFSAAIYDDCCILWSGFAQTSIEYYNREANSMAHELAMNTFLSNLNCIWVDELPSFIIAKLVNDVTMFADQ